MSGNRNKAQPKLGEGVHPPHRRPVLTLETSEAVDLTHMHEGKDPEGAHAPANDLPPVDLQPESQNSGSHIYEKKFLVSSCLVSASIQAASYQLVSLSLHHSDSQ